MIRWKFWQKKPLLEAPDPIFTGEGHDSIDTFFGYGLVDEEFETLEEWAAKVPIDLPADVAQTPTEDQPAYMDAFTDFGYWKERKPIPPRSGILKPPKPGPHDLEAEHLLTVFEKCFDFTEPKGRAKAQGLLTFKLKPEVIDRLEAARKGYQSFVVDESGEIRIEEGA